MSLVIIVVARPYDLERASTVANYATVQIEGNRKINRNVDYYNPLFLKQRQHHQIM